MSGATPPAPRAPKASAVRSWDFTWLKTEVDGCRGNCAQTAVRIPCSPARIAICSEPEPTQWPNACRSSRPVTSRTFLTAVGQSVARDVVDRELGPRRGQVDARPVVEQPDVVAACRQGTR